MLLMFRGRKGRFRTFVIRMSEHDFMGRAQKACSSQELWGLEV
jgi:hypothetical protein